MADSGKAISPGSEVKKAQEGSGKKRRKHKKKAEASGDGAPSAAPVSQSTSQSSAAASQAEGAPAAVNGDSKQESNPPEKRVARGEEQELKDSKAVGKVSRNKTGTHEAGGEEISSHGDSSADGKTHEKHLSKKENKANQLQKLKSPKQESETGKSSTPTTDESKLRKDTPRTETPKHTEQGEKNREIPEAKIQMQSGKVKQSNETPKCDGVQQKSQLQEQPQSSRAEGDHGKKPKAQTKEVVKGVSAVDGEHKAKSKADTTPGVADGEQKSKAQMRAERRAVQEAQRAAKDAKKSEPSAGVASSASTTTGRKENAGEKSKPAVEKSKPAVDKSKPAGDKIGGEKNSKKKSGGNVAVQGETEEQMWAKKEREILGIALKIDNSILNLGFQYFHHNIVGANARCMALLATLKEVITRYRTPDGKELSRDLEKNFLNPCIKYINYCRPISTSMGNAIKHLKHHINKIPSDMDDETAISKLRDEIDNFIQVNIIKAAEAVAFYANTKIDNGDVILIYAASSLIGQVLKTAYKGGKRFRVIVVEGRPRSEGKSMLRCLVRCGIPCSYIYIGSASHAMNEATKVFLGAAAMFAIGDMYSRSGNSMIAALAKANNIPVLVCCETYKFTDKVQLHTGDSNLHTRGKDLVSIGHKTPILTNWEDIGLGLLNLMYDVTGSEYITAVVTEFGMLPCTSVPVVLRRQEDLS
ncbi:unnamed protein product [Candidula unifasciata]|uniref:Translation initiation factor eIF2B subunit delta n=1 Tax=Candidula unifasciata TaxID=100452 RepID=A0A8S3ZLS5_9EUPU|nr:unnamed protein product [Candidula unifasciata]